MGGAPVTGKTWVKAEKGMASCQTGSARLPSTVGPFAMRMAFRVVSGEGEGSVEGIRLIPGFRLRLSSGPGLELEPAWSSCIDKKIATRTIKELILFMFFS